MAKVNINKDKCKGCALCVFYCPNKLLVSSKDLNKKGIHVVEFQDKKNKCTGCMMCAVICPDCALEVWK